MTSAEVPVSWEVIAGVGASMAGALAWTVKMMLATAAKDRDALMVRADEDRKLMRETMEALKAAVDVSATSVKRHEELMTQLIHSQQRLVWAQEKILVRLDIDEGNGGSHARSGA